jgi:hypothetical protein
MSSMVAAFEECEDSLSEPQLREMIDRVLDLHRGKDAYITFGRKDAGALSHTDSFRAMEFGNIFPQFAASFLRDSYVGVNACFAAGVPYVPGSKHPNLLLPPNHTSPINKKTGQSFHRESNLRYLNACYCDIDCCRDPSGPKLEKVIRDIERMCEAGDLPRPTTITESGRGLWLLWQLHDAKNESRSHLGCQPDVILRYKDTNRALGAKLAHLDADLAAIDGARLTGLHGTLKTAYQKRVVWRDYPGGRRYTLEELSVLMGVSERRSALEKECVLELRRTKRSGKVDSATSERCKRGWNKSASNRIAAFAIIESHRGGFSEGMRDKAMFMYALCLRSAWKPLAEAIGIVREKGAHCVTPLDSITCDARVRSAYSKDEKGNFMHSYLTYQTLADWLEVTVEEAQFVSQQLQNTFPAASRSGVAIQPPSQKERRAKRREAIKEICRDRSNIPSYRVIQQLLAGRGVEASHVTIGSDLKALKLESTVKRAANETPQNYKLALAV